MLLGVGVAVYVLVAVGLIAYDLWRGGPWMAVDEAVAEVVCCVLWPITLGLVAYVRLCDLFWGKDGGRPRR